MKKFIKNNEGLIAVILGFSWITYGYISNGYEFDNFPNGIFILIGGLIIMFGKYIWKKDNESPKP
jgi:hypothetical protein